MTTILNPHVTIACRGGCGVRLPLGSSPLCPACWYSAQPGPAAMERHSDPYGYRERACDRKRRYDSREAAEAGAAQITRKALTVYACGCCPGWHLTSHEWSR